MEFRPTTSSIANVSDEIVISIRPEHASNIYSGNKKYELRRSAPKSTPRIIYLYESNGDKHITGHIVIERVIAASPKELWGIVGTKSTTKERFFKYFDGASVAYAFEIVTAVKYLHDIALDKIKNIDNGFRPPQNFLYMQNLPRLKSYLRMHSTNEVLNSTNGGLQLKSFQTSSVQNFIELAIKHVSEYYLETGEEYAHKLIQISREENDSEGVMTSGKSIYEIYSKNLHIGFVVITRKNGGSIKTGPVMFFQQYIGQGFGKELRSLLHFTFQRLGYRKVYATVPANNQAATSYLLASGYKLEAHLRRHYHDFHDEFVFGYHLMNNREGGHEFIRQIEQITKHAPLKSSSSELTSFLEEEFSASYTNVDSYWSNRQIHEAIAHTKGRGSKFRPRKIYLAYGLQLLCVGLCLLKRGGSVKIILLTRTGHQRGLTNFIIYLQKSLLSGNDQKIRKFYTHIPLADTNVIQAFYDAGFFSEGVLDRPYNDSYDLLAMAKLT